MTLAEDICPVPTIAPMASAQDMDAAIESARRAVGLPVGSRVVAAMSGGVDSSGVVAAERGHWRAQVSDTDGQLVQIGGALDLSIDAAVQGLGVVYLFEDWLARAPWPRDGTVASHSRRATAPAAASSPRSHRRLG